MKYLLFLVLSILIFACSTKQQSNNQASDSVGQMLEPLINDLYTADPSAHVFNNRIYIYPSHDIDAGVKEDDLGSHFAMRDYHVYSMEKVGGPVIDHGVALKIEDIPWAGRQLWAPDAANKNGKYYFYFPAKDKEDVFRIGVAVGEKPEGPFTAQPNPIQGSFSIDPAVFQDDGSNSNGSSGQGKFYMYFGGIWGGQLQRWQTYTYDTTAIEPRDDRPAIGPRVAMLSDDMLRFAEPVKEIQLIDEAGQPIAGKDNSRRFFEAPWMHKYNGQYYFSYSTGDTHFICYATGSGPYGPFTYRGVILKPVIGWTNHHSIVNHNGKWYLFFHDSKKSGKTHLRNIKVTELIHLQDGSIKTIDVMVN